jgi:hypothetical protein
MLILLILRRQYLDFFSALSSSSLGTVVFLGIAVVFGALAVLICEIAQPQVVLNTSSLWALVLCLIVSLFVKGALSVPSLLLNLSETFVIAMIIGVFWKGKPYWRYWA